MKEGNGNGGKVKKLNMGIGRGLRAVATSGVVCCVSVELLLLGNEPANE